MAKFCERLREVLKIRDVRPSMLAYKTGISEASLSHYLAGHYEPKSKKLQTIANALRVSSAWLSGLDVPMEVNSDYPIEEITLDDGEKAWLDLYRSMTEEERALFLRRFRAEI